MPIKAHISSVTHRVYLFYFFFGECVYLNVILIQPSLWPLTPLFSLHPFDYIPSGVNMVKFSFTAGERPELPRGGWQAGAQGLWVSIQLSSFSLLPYVTCSLTILMVNSSYFSNIMYTYNSMLLNILILRLLNSHMILLPLQVLQFQQ